jgi:thioredoxin reductase
VLATEGLAMPPMALHVARQASNLSESVTIYTNGNDSLAASITPMLGSAKQIKTDVRLIKSFRMGESGRGVVIKFDDGSEATESFVAHAPRTKPKGPFSEQLGLEAVPSGDIKAAPPFYQTSVQGVFAAGDVCSPMKNVPNAIFTGNLAGTGASSQIVAEALGQKPLFG